MVSSVASFFVQVLLDFEVPFADAVSFIPMQLHPAQSAVGKANRCDTLQLALSATTVSLEKKPTDLDAHTCCDGLNRRDRANDIEFHSLILSQNRCSSKTTGYTDQRIKVTKDHVSQNLLDINRTCQTHGAVHTSIHWSVYQQYTCIASRTVDSYAGRSQLGPIGQIAYPANVCFSLASANNLSPGW